MRDQARTFRDTLAALLAILGGVACLAVPLVFLLHDPGEVVPVASLAGCAIASLVLSLAHRRAAVVTAAVAGAMAPLAVLSAFVIAELRTPDALSAAEALRSLEGAAVAAAGSLAGARLRPPASWAWVWRSLVAGAISIAAFIALLVMGLALRHLGDDAVALFYFYAMVGAPIAGGAVAVAVDDELSARHVFLGWLLLGFLGMVVGAGISVARADEVLVASGLYGAFLIAPIGGCLAAIGAHLHRAFVPVQAESPVPVARAVR
ncbi:MAG TPA: hypothetical protein VHE35_29690 [Kofleriaceae bacterium]|nr:hypothetical protein [Kofleriaceae bacterium]